MAAHKVGDAPYDPEVTLYVNPIKLPIYSQSITNALRSYTPAIPVIAPLPHRSRPELPKKKDGTVSYCNIF